MRRTFRKLAAALLGAVMLAVPANAFADGYCDKYDQVASNATGGDWVGGILMYETMATVERTENTTSETVSTSTTVGGQAVGASGTTNVTLTTTNATTTTTAQEPVGYYAMNDGSVYQINCVTGQARKVG
jgi:hypothetical protein